MSLPSRLLGANPSIQVSTLLSGSLSTPSAKQAYIDGAFDSIATFSVGSGGQSTITFDNIPQTYKHLQIRGINLSSSASNSIAGRYNSDSGTNYAYHGIDGSGSAITAYGSGSATKMDVGYTGSSTSPGIFVCTIFYYADTTRYKVNLTMAGNDANGAPSYTAPISGVWRNTNAITRIDMTHGASTTFAQYSHFALYGIG